MPRHVSLQSWELGIVIIVTMAVHILLVAVAWLAGVSMTLAVQGAPHAGLYKLPPLLEFSNGTAVVTDQQLAARREEAKLLLTETLYGTFPATVPKLSASSVVTNTTARGISDVFVSLTFDTPAKAVTFTVELLVPVTCYATGNCPLFMTQANHRRWALAGAARGTPSHPKSRRPCVLACLLALHTKLRLSQAMWG